MAYRRKQGGISRSATFKEEKNLPPDDGEWVAADQTKGGSGSGSGPSMIERGSFWGVLARKAKAILEDDNMHQSDRLLTQERTDYFNSPRANANLQQGGGGGIIPVSVTVPAAINVERQSQESGNKIEIVRGVDEGRREVKAAYEQSPLRKGKALQLQLQSMTQEDQLKAARDVAMATAAKAKLLLRELKTIRAELGFTKQRCSQLEEENKILREAREEKGTHHADDDMIRRQLETLLEEKARLAQENAVYARDNRVLREIVEYHQMTTQDVIYFDEEANDVEQEDVLFSSFSMPDSPISSPPPPYLFRSASARVLPPNPQY